MTTPLKPLSSPSELPADRSAEFDRFSENYEAHLDVLSMKALGGGSSRTFVALKCRELIQLLSTYGIDPSKAVALDAGCGTGLAEEFLSSRFKKLIGVDCSEGMVQEAKKKNLPGCDFFAADAASIPRPAGSVDVLFCFCIFHHAGDEARRAFLKEFHRLLSPKGVLVVFEHNPWNPLTRLVVRQCPVDANAQLLSAGHLRDLVQASGYRDLQSRYIIFFPRWLTVLLALERWLSWLPLGGQYLVAARRP